MFAKKAILVVSFGTSHLNTLDKNIKAIEEDVQKAYPDYKVYRAFTSQMIIKKLNTVNNISIHTVSSAMKKMQEDGMTELIIQPTHIIHGIENDNMLKDVWIFKDAFTSIKISTPLLSTSDDYVKVVDILMRHYPVKNEEALVLMGHGTSHYANSSYPALSYTFTQQGYSNVFVGTVEGYPELEHILELIKKQSITCIKLLPFMLVAGDHAQNDMNSNEEDSWKSIFLQEGYKVESIVKGLGEIKEIRDLYLDHLKNALNGDSNISDFKLFIS